jgi:hypothetical protein
MAGSLTLFAVLFVRLFESAVLDTKQGLPAWLSCCTQGDRKRTALSRLSNSSVTDVDSANVSAGVGCRGFDDGTHNVLSRPFACWLVLSMEAYESFHVRHWQFVACWQSTTIEVRH